MNSSRRTRVGWIVVLGLAVMLVASVLYIGTRKPLVVEVNLPASTKTFSATQPRAGSSQAPPELGSISGRVEDSSGAPIPNALVCASLPPSLGSFGWGQPTCTIVDEEGEYLIDNLPSNRFSLSASAPEYRPATYRTPNHSPVLQLNEGQKQTGIDFVLKKGGIEVRGFVRDVGGGGIAGAFVTIRGWTDQSSAFTHSLDDGSFSAWVEEGRFSAQASADGYASGQSLGTAPGPECEIVLTPGSVLVGRVVEAQTGSPVVAMVTAGLDQPWGNETSVQSDGDGRFRISGLSPGRYKPTARAVSGYGQARESVLLGIAETSREILIEVHAAPHVAASVLVEPDHEPCSSGTVDLFTPGSATRHATIQSDGFVRFDAVLPGNYRVHVGCDDYASLEDYPRLVVADSDVEGIVWTVRDGVTLRGRVVDQQNRPVRATVHVARVGARFGRGATSQNDDEGRFVLRGLSPGKVRVTVNPTDHVSPEPREVELGSSTPEMTIVVENGGTVMGTVTDQRTRPIAGAQVAIVGQGLHGWRLPVTSLADGTFEVKGLAAGDYRVSASYGGSAPAPFGVTVEGPSVKPVTVEVGAVARVQLVLTERQGEITGRVVDDTDRPLADAFVQAIPEAGGSGMARPQWGGSKPVISDQDGAFTLTNLAEGMYTVHAYKKGGGSASVEHVEVDSHVTVAIQRTASISGRLEIAGGGTPDRFTIRALNPPARIARHESFLHTDGTWTISDLPEGEYRVSAAAAEGTAAMEVTLAPGEERTDLVLTLSPLTTLTGRVVSLENSAAVTGVRVSVLSRDAATPPDPQGALTDQSGHFELSGVPTGAAMVLVMPADPAGSDFDPAMVPVEIEAGKTRDVGTIPMARRRLKSAEPAGDLGFTIEQSRLPFDFSEQSLEVRSVSPNGPAASSGLQVGDVIVAVDGYDVTGNRSYLYRSLTRVPEGRILSLELARGVTIALTAQATPASPAPNSSSGAPPTP